MAQCSIVDTSIDVAALEKRVAGPGNGAVVTFVGQTRDHSCGRAVASLHYSAYRPMAERMLARIAEQARERWSVDVAIEHRVGDVAVGEVSVAICIGGVHRPEAFEACRWCIDTLKETVPIWKKEFGADGSYWIEGEEAIAAG